MASDGHIRIVARIPPKLHTQVKVLCVRKGIPLYQALELALEMWVAVWDNESITEEEESNHGA